MMLSRYFVIGFFPIQPRKESMMKQIAFEFMNEISKEFDIELSSVIEDRLIERMAVVLIQVNKGGESENDDLKSK
jgi:hypothetical protein